MSFKLGGGGGGGGAARGGYSWEFFVEVCCPILQILTLFYTKKCHLSQSFSDLAFENLYHHDHYLD